jgi:ATP-NAD kinase N-terminal domain
MVGTVGIIVNPWAGKDVRRLHAPVGHTPDTAKIGIVRRVAIAALESGASHVYVARDVGRICERAVHGLGNITMVDGPGTGSPLDTRRTAASLGELGCVPIVVLGGDGTCRDAAIGYPEITMIAISTGTNNVFPRFIDGSSAGTAAGFVSTGALDPVPVGNRVKRLVIDIDTPGREPVREIALVDVAFIDNSSTGARAVVDPGSIRLVVAAMAHPASTGLSSIAGRVRPIRTEDPGAVVVRLGGVERTIRVPIIPGSFDDISIDSVESLAEGSSIQMNGPGVLAYDGERDRVVPNGSTVTISVERTGPVVIDVERALHCATAQKLFDVNVGSADTSATSEASHGD